MELAAGWLSRASEQKRSRAKVQSSRTKSGHAPPVFDFSALPAFSARDNAFSDHINVRVPVSLVVGDEVLTRNQYDPTGPLQEQTVTATEQHTAYDLREVTIQDADGSTETIQATDEHPFYVEGIGFTGAAQLTVGEQVETAEGSYATVTGNVDEPEPNGITVYNFTVDTDHTYVMDQGGAGVWVHNSCQVNIDPGKLQHEFKHAPDFGIFGNWNKASASAFKQAILDHIADPAVQVINGTFRKTIDVVHYFNPTTGLWAAVDNANNFVAGWKLSDEQVFNLFSNGNIQ